TKNVKNILGIEYLKFGFILSPTNEKLHLCLICEKIFSDEAMKPSRIKDDFIKKHQDKTKNVTVRVSGLVATLLGTVAPLRTNRKYPSTCYATPR
ncbi:protein ZBED8-like, partial [Aphis craccivora]